MSIKNFNFAFGELKYGPVDIGSVVPLRVKIVVNDHDVMMNLKKKAEIALPPGTRFEIRKKNPRHLSESIIMRWVRENRMDDNDDWVDSRINSYHVIHSVQSWCLMGRFTTPMDNKTAYLRVVK